MAVLSTLPTTTLTGDDIKDTINNYGGSADNTWLTFYDSLNDVNKWSRWKPFSYPADFVNDESILKAAHFGLQIDHMSNWGMSPPNGLLSTCTTNPQVPVHLLTGGGFPQLHKGCHLFLQLVLRVYNGVSEQCRFLPVLFQCAALGEYHPF